MSSIYHPAGRYLAPFSSARRRWRRARARRRPACHHYYLGRQGQQHPPHEGRGDTGAAKLEAARNAVVTELTTAGAPVVLHAVNAAIEAAVAASKA